ncbi:hypothetical protein ACFLZB_02815 [Nanoarchaeota archaeon]
MAKAESEWVKTGHYAFFIGAIIAVIAGLFAGLIPNVYVITLLVVLGLIVGLLNITAKETTPFLVACIALMLAGIVNLEIIPYVGIFLRAILTNIVVFVVPAAIIVGLKTIYSLAQSK